MGIREAAAAGMSGGRVKTRYGRGFTSLMELKLHSDQRNPLTIPFSTETTVETMAATVAIIMYVISCLRMFFTVHGVWEFIF